MCSRDPANFVSVVILEMISVEMAEAWLTQIVTVVICLVASDLISSKLSGGGSYIFSVAMMGDGWGYKDHR